MILPKKGSVHLAVDKVKDMLFGFSIAGRKRSLDVGSPAMYNSPVVLPVGKAGCTSRPSPPNPPAGQTPSGTGGRRLLPCLRVDAE